MKRLWFADVLSPKKKVVLYNELKPGTLVQPG